MPRYVILRHELPDGPRAGVHFDLMLEREDALRTWALAAEPANDVEISAEQLPEHRLEYLSYEGPIAGNRGSVTQWDAGEYEIADGAPEDLQLNLRGRRLTGRVELWRNERRCAEGAHQRWTFCLLGSSVS